MVDRICPYLKTLVLLDHNDHFDHNCHPEWLPDSFGKAQVENEIGTIGGLYCADKEASWPGSPFFASCFGVILMLL